MFTVFNEGVPGDGDTQLISFVAEAFKACEKGSVVWGAMFRFTDEDFANDLGAIVADRGIRLKLVAGDSETSVPDDVAAFADDHITTGGIFRCRPDGKRNHCKWLLFENLDFDKLRRGWHGQPVGALTRGVGKA